MKKFVLFFALVAMAIPSFAQQSDAEEKLEFKRHWYLQAQGGVAHTLGEADFSDLISPAMAISAGYRFAPLWGVRFGLSGWQAKGGWVAPPATYKYKFLQGNVDMTLDFSSLVAGFKAKRVVNTYIFAGLGVNGAFDNDEAVAMDNSRDFAYLWTDSKAFVAGRMGLGFDFRLSDAVLFNIEANANVLSDHFNSKKAGNADWQFNALAGFTFRLGKNYKKSKPVYVPVPAPAPAPEPAPEPKKEEPAPAPAPVKSEPAPAPKMQQDIFFLINSAEIRSSEQSKIDALASFLKEHPTAKVSVVGYADAKTGNASINDRLSKRRAASVAAALEKLGIAADRVEVGSKGDTEQPFSVNDQNRVTICIAE